MWSGARCLWHKGFTYYINEVFAFCRVWAAFVGASILVVGVVERLRFWVGGREKGVK